MYSLFTMNYITTTNLRTQSSQLIKTLKQGGTVSLIHHSKIVGVIKPQKEARPITEKDIQELQKLAEELNLPKTSYKERERIYRKHLEEKYGNGLS